MNSINCIKCGECGDLKLRTKDVYCTKCFIASVNHKFRASIGKHKNIISLDKKVLVNLSSINSVVLLDLIHTGLSQNSYKKLFIRPVFIHILGLDHTGTENIDFALSLIKQCHKLNFELYVIHASEYLSKDLKPPIINTLPSLDHSYSEFYNLLKGISSTAIDDLLTNIERKLLITYAELLKCDLIFTSESSLDLAVNLLTNIALGRGGQNANQTGIIDDRDENVKIFRPMKDITSEEIKLYIEAKNLFVTKNHSESNAEKDIHSTIKSFVNSLDNVQSTVATVAKTAEKLGGSVPRTNVRKCQFCQSNVFQTAKLTAQEATDFSKYISSTKQSCVSSQDCVQNLNFDMTKKAIVCETNLCYTCKKYFEEMQSGFKNAILLNR